MVGVLAVGFVANLLIRPVDAKYHEDLTDHHAQVETDRQAGLDAEAELSHVQHAGAAGAVVGCRGRAAPLRRLRRPLVTALNLF